MPSSLFGNRKGNSILDAVNQLKSMGNPNAMYSQMYQNDSQFRQFADSMRGKTPEQAFQENGLDFAAISSLMR